MTKINTEYDLGDGVRIKLYDFGCHDDLPGGIAIQKPGFPIIEGSAREWVEFCDAVMTGSRRVFYRMAVDTYCDDRFMLWSPRNTQYGEEIFVEANALKAGVRFILGALAAFSVIAKENAGTPPAE